MLRPGRAHAAPRPRTSCALGSVSWRTGHRVVAPLWLCHRRFLPCHRAHALCRSAVSRASAMSRHKAAPPFAIQKLYHDIKLMSHALGRVMRAAACVAAPCAISWRAISQRSAIFPFHDTKHCIATHLSSQDACARCSSLLRTGRPCRGACLSCRAWPCVPLCAYVTIQFAVS